MPLSVLETNITGLLYIAMGFVQTKQISETSRGKRNAPNLKAN